VKGPRRRSDEKMGIPEHKSREIKTWKKKGLSELIARKKGTAEKVKTTGICRNKPRKKNLQEKGE